VDGFGSKVLVHDPYVPEEETRRLGYRPVPLDELLRQSDIVSLHA
jgi:D-3-phosphoglycerate dehydrogenase / 2-oxoglutarate reductase